MKRPEKHVAVIGAGVTGMTAADELVRMGLGVTLFEKSPFLGGHAIELSCKAVNTCVKCGACMAEEKLQRVARQEKVTILTGIDIFSVSGREPFEIAYGYHSPMVNAEQCDGCGLCLKKCPVPGTILQGRATRVGPYVAIRKELCRYFHDGSCALCQEACPRDAIHLAPVAHENVLRADAVLLATGFAVHNPSDKPYGYGRFENVITSLDAERLLREDLIIKRPSDGRPVQRIAFVQCVGSRDAKLGHPWCSKICCGSALRMARLIQSRQNDVHATFFYIDVQTFGKDFHHYYTNVRENVEMVRAIPGDIVKTDQDQLQAFYFDPQNRSHEDALFDLVVLSVGLVPPGENGRVTRMLQWSCDGSGFLHPHDGSEHKAPEGLFSAGAAVGPMTIAESVSSAEKAVFDIFRYFDRSG